jgi:hypothetical protein
MLALSSFHCPDGVLQHGPFRTCRLYTLLIYTLLITAQIRFTHGYHLLAIYAVCSLLPSLWFDTFIAFVSVTVQAVILVQWPLVAVLPNF